MDEPPADQPRPPADQAMLICPVCDMRLVERGCKLRCPRCHYYMSCSDYV